MKEWFVPIGLGLLVGAIFLMLPESEPPLPAEISACGGEVHWVFEDGPAAFFGQVNTTLLAIGNAPNATWCQPGEPGIPEGRTHTLELPDGPVVAVPALEARVQCVRAPCPQDVAPWFAINPVDGRTFEANTTQVKLELYAFTSDGQLLTSSAPSFRLANYTLYGDYFPLSNVWWFVGNGTAPQGTYELPFGRQAANEALMGQPIGGIATIHLESHPYAWLVGDVWVTGLLLDTA